VDIGDQLKHNTNNESYYEITNVTLCRLTAIRDIGGGIIRETEKFLRQEGET
jgi:hypothetical protein